MEKVNISGANTRTETTQEPKKEAEILKVKAELKAGLVIMEDAAKQIAKIKEKLEREHDSAARELEDNGRDTADISQTRKWAGAGRTDTENLDLSWSLEMEAEIWNSFLNWNPVPGISFSMQLEDLSDMYLTLLEAVLKYTMGEAQAVQMERLESVLSEKLNLLVDSHLKELVVLLEETGQTDALAGIQSSVYKQTTGQSISHKEAREFFNRSRFTMTPPSDSFSSAQRSGGRTSLVGSQTSASSHASSPAYSPTRSLTAHSSAQSLTAKSSAQSLTTKSSAQSLSTKSSAQTLTTKSSAALKDGMIYQASGGGKVRPNKGFAAQRNLWEGQISQRKEVINNARKGNIQSSSTWGTRNSFTGRELARANQFVSHLSGSGDLFNHSGITAQNDEILGLLAAVTSMKGQIFAANTGQKNAIAFTLQSAITRMIDSYIRQKASANVYYYTINVYNKTKNPQKAIESGVEYAYRQFKEKQADSTFQTQTDYSRQAGFFQAIVKEPNVEREFSFGLRILEKNWKEFLRAIGRGTDSSFILKLERQSPWGSLMEPAKHKTGKQVDIEKFLLIAIITFLAIATAYFLLRSLWF